MIPHGQVPARIVSGGQTGVDRGALDAALEHGADCGGWCPENRAAEDGAIPSRYPLRELPGAGYAERTRRNVADSDGTLVIMFANPGRGTLLTVRHARRLDKPLLLIDGDRLSMEAAVRQARQFVERHRVRVLNVAGPRASGAPRAYGYAREVIRGILSA